MLDSLARRCDPCRFADRRGEEAIYLFVGKLRPIPRDTQLPQALVRPLVCSKSMFVDRVDLLAQDLSTFQDGGLVQESILNLREKRAVPLAHDPQSM